MVKELIKVIVPAVIGIGFCVGAMWLLTNVPPSKHTVYRRYVEVTFVDGTVRNVPKLEFRSDNFLAQDTGFYIYDVWYPISDLKSFRVYGKTVTEVW